MGPRTDIGHVGVACAKGLEFGRMDEVVAQDFAAESEHDMGKDAPDLSGPDHGDGLAVQGRSP